MSLLLYAKGSLLSMLLARLVRFQLVCVHIPFQEGRDHFGRIPITNWQVDSFNPLADLQSSIWYIGFTASVLALAIALKRWPFLVRVWLGLISLMILLSELVLVANPVPSVTPGSFSTLWSQVLMGSLVAFPTIWALLVGLIPVSPFRVLAYGALVPILVLVFSACRLAFFLAIAYCCGVLWLPLCFVLGGSLLDFMVIVVFFARVMETEGPRWGGQR